MRVVPLALILAALLATPAAAATRNVRVADNYFKPRTLTVRKGTVVKWNWVGRHWHNVVVRKGPRHFRSALKRTGSFRHRMRTRGTYRIVCLIHAPDMRMTLRVE